MKTIRSIIDTITLMLFGTSLLLLGLLFFLLGVTFLPVIGVLLSIPLMYLGFSAWKWSFYIRPVEILAGSGYHCFHEYNGLEAQGLVPVAILSTSKERGEALDFDARTVDPATVRFEPDGIEPVNGISDPKAMSDRERDVDGDGDTDLVFYFPYDQARAPGSIREIRISGKTIGGTRIRGCTTLKAGV